MGGGAIRFLACAVPQDCGWRGALWLECSAASCRARFGWGCGLVGDATAYCRARYVGGQWVAAACFLLFAALV